MKHNNNNNNGDKRVPAYMVVQDNYKPNVVIQVVPGDLEIVIGFNKEPKLHGVVGIKYAGQEASDVIIISEDVECFRQLGKAFEEAANNLQREIDKKPRIITGRFGV